MSFAIAAVVILFADLYLTRDVPAYYPPQRDEYDYREFYFSLSSLLPPSRCLRLGGIFLMRPCTTQKKAPHGLAVQRFLSLFIPLPPSGRTAGTFPATSLHSF